MSDSLIFTCEELREIADTNPNEIEVIIEMLIESDEELCAEAAWSLKSIHAASLNRGRNSGWVASPLNPA